MIAFDYLFFLAPRVGMSPQIAATICVRWGTATEYEWRLNNVARSRFLNSEGFIFSIEHEERTKTFKNNTKKRAGLGIVEFCAENLGTLSPFASLLNGKRQCLLVL